MDPLDYPKAALRMLLELSKNLEEGLNVIRLYETMNERFGVGRSATSSSYKALLSADLVEVNKKKVEGHNFSMIKLTAKGLEVSIKIREIATILVNTEDYSILLRAKREGMRA
jgi:hypothetical protein